MGSDKGKTVEKNEKKSSKKGSKDKEAKLKKHETDSDSENESEEDKEKFFNKATEKCQLKLDVQSRRKWLLNYFNKQNLKVSFNVTEEDGVDKNGKNKRIIFFFYELVTFFIVSHCCLSYAV